MFQFFKKREPKSPVSLDEATAETPVATVTCNTCKRVARKSVAMNGGWLVFESFDGDDAFCPQCQ